MVALKMPAFNLCMLAGYAEQVPELHTLKNGSEFAEFFYTGAWRNRQL